jgi:hypothetical protein
MNSPNDGFLPGESVEQYMRRTGMWQETVPAQTTDIRQTVRDALVTETSPDSPLSDASMRSRISPDAIERGGRMDAALDEALAMNIVRVRRIASGKPDARVMYLLASSHFEPGTNNGRQPQEAKLSQAELFRLSHLMSRHDVPCTLLVEGMAHAGKPISTNRILLPNPDGSSTRMSDPTIQRRLFDHPGELLNIMDAILQKPGGFQPMFYSLGTLPYDGAETPESIAKHDAMVPLFLRFEEFAKKVLWPIEQSTNKDGIAGVQASTAPGKRYLRFNESVVHGADEFLRGIRTFLQDAEAWKSFNLERETETARLLRNSAKETTPVAWMGAAHAPKVANLLSNDCDVVIVTPVSSAHFDQDSIEKRATSSIDFAASLMRTAEEALRKS